MDILTLAQLNKLKKDGGAGYTKPAKVLTWDGNVGDAELMDGMYLLSTTAYDLSAVERITISSLQTGGSLVYEKDNLVVTTDNGAQFVEVDALEADILIASVPGMGTLVYAGVLYISRIEFAKTIHPIDPKYLSGVCLPVVDLSSVASGAAITDAETVAILDNAYSTAPGILANVNLSGSIAYFFLGRTANDGSGGTGFFGIAAATAIVLQKVDATWSLVMASE